MTRLSGVRHPRWIRAFIAAAFVASAAIGASFGLEERHEPVTLAAAAYGAVSRPASARLLDTHLAIPFFVAPQPMQYSPYGTPVAIPQIGIPATIQLSATQLAPAELPTGQLSVGKLSVGHSQPVISCDLISGTISQTVFVMDDAGQPVSGANVVFTVTRSDIEVPQLVTDITGFDGAATVTVKVPSGAATPNAIATYSVLAEAVDVAANTPAAELRFGISDYTCTGGTGAH